MIVSPYPARIVSSASTSRAVVPVSASASRTALSSRATSSSSRVRWPWSSRSATTVTATSGDQRSTARSSIPSRSRSAGASSYALRIALDLRQTREPARLAQRLRLRVGRARLSRATGSLRRLRSMNSGSARSSSVSLSPAMPASTRGAYTSYGSSTKRSPALLQPRHHAAALEADVQHADQRVEAVLVAPERLHLVEELGARRSGRPSGRAAPRSDAPSPGRR